MGTLYTIYLTPKLKNKNKKKKLNIDDSIAISLTPVLSVKVKIGLLFYSLATQLWLNTPSVLLAPFIPKY